MSSTRTITSTIWVEYAPTWRKAQPSSPRTKNKNFYKNVVLAPQPRTLLPDRLSQRPFAPTGPGQLMLQTFTDQYTISDGNQTIELYHVDGLNHSDNMLIAYLPKQKIVISADMGGPPAGGIAAACECQSQLDCAVPQHQAA